MFYKITNKDSKVYQDLVALLDKEASINEYNRSVANEVTKGLDWEKFIGFGTQCNFNRVKYYRGFCFKDPDKVNPKEWREDKEYPGAYRPNKRTKAGKDIQSRLNQQKRSDIFFLEPIFGINLINGVESFKFPQIFLQDDVLAIYLDDKHIPKDENVIEITSKEFKEILNIKD